MVTRSRMNLFFLNLVGLLLGFSGCDGPHNPDGFIQPEDSIPDSVVNQLQLDTVQQKRLVRTITLNGVVDFNENDVVNIYPLVSGRVVDVPVMLGDFVQKGQVLAKVESKEMTSYGNELNDAETNLKFAREENHSKMVLYQSGLASKIDLAASQAALRKAGSEVSKIRQLIAINGGGTQGVYTIRSPIKGFIVQKFVTDLMDIRQDFSGDLFSISDLNHIWVMANVYESNIPDVHLNDSVEITTLSYPGKVFRGKINKIMNVLDPTNKVMKVQINLDNPGYLLKPQMFASVTVINPEDRQMLGIPSRDVVFDNSQYYVLVYDSIHHIVITPVQVITTTHGWYYVSSGLKSGERVVGSQTLLIYQALNG